MTREEHIIYAKNLRTALDMANNFSAETMESLDAVIKALEQEPRWIPVKWHNITEKEREQEGYPKEWLTMFDCPMPKDEEEILVTIKSRRGGLHVEKDICYVDDGYSLDSGYDWIDDVVAWMQLPIKPYKAESEDN